MRDRLEGAPVRRARALAVALVVWFVAMVLFDVVTLNIASVLRSGTASRVLILSVLANPIGAVRTGALLTIEGTAAFGAGLLALLRFTNGPFDAGLLIAGALLAWIVAPTILAARTLSRLDL